MPSPAKRSAPRLYIPAGLSPGAELDLPERAARHISVLRLARGDAVTLFNGEGGEFGGELVRVSRDGARVRIGACLDIERESPLAITLVQCVSSGDRMDLTLQKATELGVGRIVPVVSERSVVRLASERADRRVAHWRAVVAAACEQCGRNRVPGIAPITPLDGYLEGVTGDALRLVLAPDATRGLRECGPVREVILLVGPEGGLSPAERRRAETRGFLPVRFGPRTLRTETAPLAVMAAMQSLWGDC